MFLHKTTIFVYQTALKKSTILLHKTLFSLNNLAFEGQIFEVCKCPLKYSHRHAYLMYINISITHHLIHLYVFNDNKHPVEYRHVK